MITNNPSRWSIWVQTKLLKVPEQSAVSSGGHERVWQTSSCLSRTGMCDTLLGFVPSTTYHWKKGKNSIFFKSLYKWIIVNWFFSFIKILVIFLISLLCRTLIVALNHYSYCRRWTHSHPHFSKSFSSENAEYSLFCFLECDRFFHISELHVSGWLGFVWLQVIMDISHHFLIFRNLIWFSSAM